MSIKEKIANGTYVQKNFESVPPIRLAAGDVLKVGFGTDANGNSLSYKYVSDSDILVFSGSVVIDPEKPAIAKAYLTVETRFNGVDFTKDMGDLFTVFVAPHIEGPIVRDLLKRLI